MSCATRLVLVIAGLGTALATAGHVPDKQPAPATPEELPAGALQRLGSTQFRLGDGLSTAVLSGDGKRAAVLTSFSGVCLVDMTTGRLMYKKMDYRPYSDEGLAFSPDGRLLASLSAPRSIELWDVDQKKSRHVFNAQHPPKSVTFSPDGKWLAVGEAVGKEGDHVSLWNVAAGTNLRTFAVLQNLSVKAVFSPDSDLLATWGNIYADTAPKDKEPLPSQTVQLWNVATGKELGRVVIDGDRVDAVAFSTDQKTLAILTWKTGLEIRDIASGKLLRKLQHQFVWGKWVRFSPDGRFLVALERYGKAQLWDTATWKSRAVAGGPDLRITSVVFADKQVLACAISGQTLQLRDLANPPKPAAAEEHRYPVQALQFLSKRSLLSVDVSGQVFLWERDAGKPLGAWHLRDQLPGDSDPQRRFPRSVVAAKGKYLAVWDFVTQHVQVVDLAQKKKVWSLARPGTGLDTAMAFAPDHKLAVFIQDLKNVKDPKKPKDPETVVVWDVEAGREFRTLTLPAAAANCKRFGFAHVVFSPDGQLLAAAVQYNELGKVGTEVFVWDLKTGYEKRHLVQDTSYTPVLAFSPDGSLLALGGPREGIALVNVWTGKLHRLEGVQRSLDVVAFSPDGRTIAGVSYSNKDEAASLYLWERFSGTLRVRYQGHWGKVAALAYAPNGQVLASGGTDGTVLLWDTTGKEVFAKGSADPQQLWTQLARPTAADAFPAMGQLVGQPEMAVAFLKEKLQPDKAKVVGPDEIRQWLAELDDEKFKVREQAAKSLRELGERVLPELHKVMKTKITLEMRVRLEKIMNDIQGMKLLPEELRQHRAVAVLEQIRSKEARQLLEELARGSPGAALTEEAQAALARLKQNP
jgi:WD40 repeat protein